MGTVHVKTKRNTAVKGKQGSKSDTRSTTKSKMKAQSKAKPVTRRKLTPKVQPNTIAKRLEQNVDGTVKLAKEHTTITLIVQVSLRTSSGVIGKMKMGPNAQQMAIAMGYVLRNRRRWADRETTRNEQSRETRAMLEKELSLSESALRDVARAGSVEVEVPYLEESVAWEGRVMPWEYVLSGATRLLRHNQPLVVCRRLLKDGTPARPIAPPVRHLFVETAPSALREGYSFDYERKLVQESLGPTVHTRVLRDPTRGQLELAVREFAPDVIHVTGFDNHQGLTLLGEEQDPSRRDGILLRTEDNSPDPVPAQDAARLLTSATTKPMLVSLNLFNSASRVASLVVANGAGAAIGFQDEFEDPLAELFFATFYREWNKHGWRTHAAFRDAMATLRARPEGLQGTGIALWTSYSMFDKPVVSLPTGTTQQTDAGQAASGTAIAATDVRTSGDVEVKVDPITNLNYSMLHNNRELFDVFLLRNFTPDVSHEIHVKVTLFVGTESYPCESSFTLTEPVKDLSKEIHVPLISILGRSVRESMRTSLYVEVRCDDVLRHCRTYPVTLLPIDEWRDDDDNRHWLPSFVLPRDPAVLAIVDAAQRYLMALRDDPNAGFDGYQSYDDGTSSDPGEPIDLQVQALWCALLYDMPLSYINPPPTFTEYSQRLRAPSDVVGSKRGTCIDLALLMASCLEYVEIYPVIILLDGHAFPGYWRNEKAHDEFERVLPPETIRKSDPNALREVTKGQEYAWLFDKSCYREVRECLQRNDLILLETVSLTQRTGFWEAVDEGTKNLRNRSEFHSMMDILLARESNVTPLPMIIRSEGVQ
jgi:hypothetical protein